MPWRQQRFNWEFIHYVWYIYYEINTVIMSYDINSHLAKWNIKRVIDMFKKACLLTLSL